MTPGTTDGTRCARLNRDPRDGTTSRCDGTIQTLGQGLDAVGRGYRFLGCDRGCWSTKETLPEPDTLSLFDQDMSA